MSSSTFHTSPRTLVWAACLMLCFAVISSDGAPVTEVVFENVVPEDNDPHLVPEDIVVKEPELEAAKSMAAGKNTFASKEDLVSELLQSQYGQSTICGTDTPHALPGMGCLGRGFNVIKLKVNPIQYELRVTNLPIMKKTQTGAVTGAMNADAEVEEMTSVGRWGGKRKGKNGKKKGKKDSKSEDGGDGGDGGNGSNGSNGGDGSGCSCPNKDDSGDSSGDGSGDGGSNEKGKEKGKKKGKRNSKRRGELVEENESNSLDEVERGKKKGKSKKGKKKGKQDDKDSNDDNKDDNKDAISSNGNCSCNGDSSNSTKVITTTTTKTTTKVPGQAAETKTAAITTTTLTPCNSTTKAACTTITSNDVNLHVGSGGSNTNPKTGTPAPPLAAAPPGWSIQKINNVQYYLPDTISYQDISSGSSSTKSRIYNDASSYATSWGVKLGVSGGMSGVTAGASVGTHDTYKNTHNSNYRMASTSKKISQYRLRLKRSAWSNLNSALLTALKTLVGNDDVKKWESDVFDQYGTHVATQVLVGGKIEMKSRFTSTKSSAAAAHSFSASLSAGATGIGAQAGMNQSTSTSSNNGLKVSSSSIQCIGGDQSLCHKYGNHSKWERSVGNHASVIDQTIKPLHEVVPYQYADQVKKMTEAYSNYLGHKCGPPKKFVGGQMRSGGFCNHKGTCNPDTGKCMCKGGFTGKDCTTRQIPYNAQVTMSGYGKWATAYPCQQGYKGCWNLNAGHLKYQLKNGNTCAPYQMVVPEGVEVKTYTFSGGWNSGWNGEPQCTGSKLTGKCTGWPGTGKVKGTQTCNSWWNKVFCMYHIGILPGYKCGGPGTAKF